MANAVGDSLGLVNIYVHESTIQKKIEHGRYYGGSQCSPNISAHQKVAKDHLDTPQHQWENVLGADKKKVELFGENTQYYTWRK